MEGREKLKRELEGMRERIKMLEEDKEGGGAVEGWRREREGGT